MKRIIQNVALRGSGREMGGSDARASILWEGMKRCAATAAGAGILAGALAFADPSIATMVNNAVNLVFGMVAFGGIVNIVRGAATVAKGLQDDGGGQDASAISKGRGQLLAGAVMVAPTALITLITQQSPGVLIANYFS